MEPSGRVAGGIGLDPGGAPTIDSRLPPDPYPVLADSVLAQIADEAHRLTGGKCAIRVHGDVTPTLVIELPGDSIVRGRWLNKHLTEFCEREGLARRYLVVGGTEPRFEPKARSVPDAWPADPGGGGTG